VFYQQAEADVNGLTPRSAIILASWHARTGDQAGAERILTSMAAGVPEMEIALPGLIANAGRRPVARAMDGLSETYATFGGAVACPGNG